LLNNSRKQKKQINNYFNKLKGFGIEIPEEYKEKGRFFTEPLETRV